MKFVIEDQETEEVVWSLKEYGNGIALYAGPTRVLEINPEIKGMNRNPIHNVIPGLVLTKEGYLATHTEVQKGL